MLIFNKDLRQEAMREIRAVRNLGEPLIVEGDDSKRDNSEEDEEGNKDKEEEGLEMDRLVHLNRMEDEQGYNRLYEWEMLLDQDELEFEYLGEEDQLEEEKHNWKDMKLSKIKGKKRKHQTGVRFTSANVKNTRLKLEEATVKLGSVEKDFVCQTLHAFYWIKNERVAGYKLSCGDFVMLRVRRILVIKVFEGLECVYSIILRPNVLVQEIH